MASRRRSKRVVRRRLGAPEYGYMDHDVISVCGEVCMVLKELEIWISSEFKSRIGKFSFEIVQGVCGVGS